MRKHTDFTLGSIYGARMERDSIIALCKKYKKRKIKGEDKMWAAHYLGYNEALNDLISLIK